MAKLTTRDRIINAAINKFCTHGFNGTTTAEIAKEAECAEGTIFRYFPKKIDLLKYVAEEFTKRFAGGIATKTLYELLEHSEGMSDEELVKAVMIDRIRLVEENFEILKIVIYEINFHDEVKHVFMDEFLKNILGLGHEIANRLEQKIGAGKLDEMDVLRTVFGQVLSILIASRLVPDQGRETVVMQMVESSAHIVINGLKGMAK